MDYSKKKRTELTALCKERKIRGFSKMKIDGLVKSLKEYDLQPSPPADTNEKNNEKTKISVSDISSFFSISSRNENDATNKIREKVLKLICNPPKEFIEDEKFGNSWRLVHQEWNNALKNIAEETDIPVYTSTEITVKGGRNSNYDADILYYNGIEIVANRKIEFKNGGSSIDDLPQFLSLQAKIALFAETYDKFWYENYLDKYLVCDALITESKPSLEVYLKSVTNTSYSITPFFAQLKSRELFFQKEKNDVVNKSITDYLSQYGNTIDIASFSEKVKATQSEKIYLLWCNGKFYLDKLFDEEMSGMSFHSIKNGNVLELKTGHTIYGLLLRWRNHKGILNPAWQISMKRQK